MILMILVLMVMIWSPNRVVGYTTVYEYREEPMVKDFESLDDAMEYNELRKTGWQGDINDFYRWKEEE